MDYSDFFSLDALNFMRSPVRDIFKVVDLNSIYSFAGGYPDAQTFPLDKMKELTTAVVEKYGAKALQYGPTQGIKELREALAKRYDIPSDNILISTSSQQGIDICARVLLDPDDVVLAANPTYLGALQSFKSYRAQVVGMDLSPTLQAAKKREEQIAQILSEGKKIKYFYAIPDFQNPSGETLSLAQRSELVTLARKYNFLIVEDSPYRELRYEGKPVATIYSLAPERTIHLCSFSKIFAPGLRLGWIVANETILNKIYECKQSLDLCAPIFDQYLMVEFINSGMLEKNLPKSIALYKKKRDMMISLLEKYMPKGVSWTHPEGGLFLFLTLPENIDTIKLYDKALKAGVAYVAGSFFYVDGSHKNTMRLNFSFIDSARMENGIKILASLL
ncbi:MAG TPA: aminotransferase [Rikenellaceae bacterium]|nr:aminotransferase [Rikenellaceae bacterium]